jgi:hypothetical protein
VEARLDGSIAVRYNGVYLDINVCTTKPSVDNPQVQQSAKPVRKDHNRGGRSNWMQTLNLQNQKPIWQLTR